MHKSRRQADKDRTILKNLQKLRNQVHGKDKIGLLGYLLDMSIEYATLSLDASREPSKRMQNLIAFRTIDDEDESDASWWLLQVCKRYEVSPNRLFGATRGLKKHTEPKAVFTYGLLTFYSMTLQQVGEFMNRDRTTSAYHERNIADQRETDQDLDDWLTDMENRIYVARTNSPFSPFQKRMQVKLSSTSRQN